MKIFCLVCARIYEEVKKSRISKDGLPSRTGVRFCIEVGWISFPSTDNQESGVVSSGCTDPQVDTPQQTVSKRGTADAAEQSKQCAGSDYPDESAGSKL